MANAQAENWPAGAQAAFGHVWKLSQTMKAAGWAHLASSDGASVSLVPATDLWNAAVPTTNGAWWLGQGPSTLKIPFTVAVTGTFLRGEQISQATSTATGEVVGIVWDGVSVGYMVVAPRTGVFDNTHVITGAFSGASFTPNGTIVNYARQVVFWRASTTAGHIYYQCVDDVGEAAEQFSYATRLAAATATVCPGGASGAGANGFPGTTSGTTGNGTFVVRGTGGSGAFGTGSATWSCLSTTPVFTNAQILCANATPSAGVSADGSFVCAMSMNAVNAGAHAVFAFQRCDNSEDGDVDPYVWLAPSGTAYGSGVRTSSAVAPNSSMAEDGFFALTQSPWGWNGSTVAINGLKSWRNRGCTSGEGYIDLQGAILCALMQAQTAILGQAAADTEKVATALVNTYVREPIWCISYTSGKKMRKGTLRWLFAVQGFNGTDTYDSLKWIELANSAANVAPLVAGPGDGVTTPSSV